jgi:phosphoribosyl 1,2-cyclic phosphodiesterase
MAKFATLASSSAGNSTYLASSAGALLVDAGISFRRVGAALASFGEEPSSIRAVLLTHAHIDHIKGLSVLLKKTGAALFATAPVLEEVTCSLRLPEDATLCAVTPNEPFEAAGMRVRAFSTMHDSAGSVGYRVETPDEHTIAVATDLGVVTDEVEAGLLGAQAVLLESNYDPFLLKMSAYPPHLKARIASEIGHLSNDDAAKFACRLLQNGTTHFSLGHLSRENNNPALAGQTTRDALSALGAREGSDFLLQVAPYDDPGRLVRL